MRHSRAVVAALATSMILAGYTVVEADDEVPTTTTEAPAPSITEAVTITVAPPEDEPDPEPAPTEAPDTTTAEPETTSVEVTTAATDTTTAVVETSTTNVQQTHDETAIITGTQVAVGDSGNNTAVNEQPSTGITVPQGAAIDTGSATAVGSSDENVVTQGADVVLTDEAIANILQIALVLNIGAALANSGFNAIESTPGGTGSPGAIGTGNATAVGNDIDSYLTQAARVGADATADDAANQLAISMFLGLAVSNSGLNSVTGTGVAGSGGQVGAGDATAIGNDSLTDINQQAAVLGSGQSVTNITQRATVLNLGFALANSGLNGIEGVAGSLLAADDATDDQVAQDLFVMLLPALLQSYGYVGAGYGQIGTGDALAVGNRSETYVQQFAAAMASGDGVASIVQEVLVANVGAAGANTGGNQLGRSITDLDEPTARAVVMMSAFLAQLLSMVHQTANQMTSAGIEVPFGDLVLQLNGSFGSLDTTLSKGGAKVNMRQVSIVLSLGVAKANTGVNQTVTANTAPQVALDSSTDRTASAEVNTDAALAGAQATLAAIDALPNQIYTGDVEGRNTNLVIICQRINAQDVACLAPPPPPVEPPPVTPPTSTTQPPTIAADAGTVPATTQAPLLAVAPVTPTTGPAPRGFTTRDSSTHSEGGLPDTGSNIDLLLLLAAAVLGGGAILVLSARRRTRDDA